MKSSNLIKAASLAAFTLALNVGAASAAVVITEVDPYGSNSSDGYSADWFELTNTGTTAVSIAGWTMVDNHAASSTSSPYSSGATISIGNLSGSNATLGAAPLTLVGPQSIAAGQTVIFLESSSSAANSATLFSNFESAWFGTNVPSNLALGTYNDSTSSNYGLSQTTDMVNIFNGSSTTSALIASVAFGSDGGTPVSTFDNSAGLNNATLTQKSVLGVNGAFVSNSGLELGSPGSVSNTPLPGTLGLLMGAMMLFGLYLPNQTRRFKV